MLFISVEDFFRSVKTAPPMTREEEKALAIRMADGDKTARGALVRRYLPMAASYVRRLPRELQTLHSVYACIAALEAGVDSFNFLQDGETFTHHLSWRLRQCITRCIADRRG